VTVETLPWRMLVGPLSAWWDHSTGNMASVTAPAPATMINAVIQTNPRASGNGSERCAATVECQSRRRAVRALMIPHRIEATATVMPTYGLASPTNRAMINAHAADDRAVRCHDSRVRSG